jgi:hypothetical protein
LAHNVDALINYGRALPLEVSNLASRDRDRFAGSLDEALAKFRHF